MHNVSMHNWLYVYLWYFISISLQHFLAESSPSSSRKNTIQNRNSPNPWKDRNLAGNLAHLWLSLTVVCHGGPPVTFFTYFSRRLLKREYFSIYIFSFLVVLTLSAGNDTVSPVNILGREEIDWCHLHRVRKKPCFPLPVSGHPQNSVFFTFKHPDKTCEEAKLDV